MTLVFPVGSLITVQLLGLTTDISFGGRSFGGVDTCFALRVMLEKNIGRWQNFSNSLRAVMRGIFHCGYLKLSLYLA